jgi:hypothetical protein
MNKEKKSTENKRAGHVKIYTVWSDIGDDCRFLGAYGCRNVAEMHYEVRYGNAKIFERHVLNKSDLENIIDARISDGLWHAVKSRQYLGLISGNESSPLDGSDNME